MDLAGRGARFTAGGGGKGRRAAKEEQNVTQPETGQAGEPVIVIPARWGSKRFPGKPLVPIAGVSLLERTWRIAAAVRGVAEVHIATDDPRIATHAAAFGASVLMTRPECANGTERVREAVAGLERRPGAVINLQGDAVLTPPWVIQALVDALAADSGVAMVTPAVRLTWGQYAAFAEAKQSNPTSGTLAVFDRDGNALYFSKALIPTVRTRPESAGAADPSPLHRHIGLYGYRADVLETLASLPPTPLEQAEQLEQLRALENGIPIRVVVVDYRGRTQWSVDTPQDVATVEALIAREGELAAAGGRPGDMQGSGVRG